MVRRDSPQTCQVLQVLLANGQTWRHGYDIARETGLKPGTLYPILARLTERGLLDSRWEDDPPTGRPRRHLYRLTPQGTTHAASQAAPAISPAVRHRPRLADGRS